MAISRKLISDCISVCGAIAIAVGTGLIFLPAGLIVGGALALAGGLFVFPVGEES